MSELPHDLPSRNVLFLCTGNSARSIFAECALGRFGAPRFRAFSAGSQPKSAPHPMTLRVLEQRGYDTSGLRSKSWDEFATPFAPPLHFVITVCDSARGESCPVWPGRPATAHWGVPDPAAFEGPEIERLRLFEHVYLELERRSRAFASLPLDDLDAPGLKAALASIGEPAGPAPR